MIPLSLHASDLLLSARSSTPGIPIMSTKPPAALRELLDYGLVNSYYKLTRRGAAEHAARVGAEAVAVR